MLVVRCRDCDTIMHISSSGESEGFPVGETMMLGDNYMQHESL